MKMNVLFECSLNWGYIEVAELRKHSWAKLAAGADRIESENSIYKYRPNKARRIFKDNCTHLKNWTVPYN